MDDSIDPRRGFDMDSDQGDPPPSPPIFKENGGRERAGKRDHPVHERAVHLCLHRIYLRFDVPIRRVHKIQAMYSLAHLCFAFDSSCCVWFVAVEETPRSYDCIGNHCLWLFDLWSGFSSKRFDERRTGLRIVSMV